MADPHDPNSIPMLTDVIVPGRAAVGRPGGTQPETAPLTQPEAAATSPSAGAGRAEASHAAAALDAREVEFIAERLRSRFSAYLRQDARGVVEARCREAIEEHTNWLVRQVTREVLSALEQEVALWVRDAVSEELARHTSRQ
jgi:hypothetical protein